MPTDPRRDAVQKLKWAWDKRKYLWDHYARTGTRSDHLAATQSDKAVHAALKLVGKLYGRDGDSLGRDLSDTGTVEETMKFLDVTSKPKEHWPAPATALAADLEAKKIA
ncbi:MAG: hypothetical protein JWL65_4019 [Gammaproteobacteria bacterium]|jgi:hypothetical protein|nr:hypothetical protein [Gammaproteobacteria bacterium]